MNVYALLPMFSFIASIILGLYVIYMGSREQVNQQFAFLMITAGIWAFADMMEFSAPTGDAAFPWMRLGTIAATFTVFFMLHFLLVFSNVNARMRYGILTIVFPFTISFLLLGLFTEYISGTPIIQTFWGYKDTPGFLFNFFSIYLICTILLGLIICYQFYKSQTDKKRKSQAKLMMAAFSIPFVGGVITEIFLPELGYNTMPLSTTLMAIMASITAFAITKYDLLTYSHLKKKLESTETALKISEEKWLSMAKNAPNGIVILDKKGTIQYANRRIFKVDLGNKSGSSFFDYIQPRYHDLTKKNIHEVFETGNPTEYEIAIPGMNRKQRWYEVRVGPIKENDEVIAVAFFLSDITENKNAEFEIQWKNHQLELKNDSLQEINHELSTANEQLRRTQDKMDRFFSLSAELICEAELSTTRFTSVNAAFTRVLGYSRDKLLSSSFLDFLHPDDVEKTKDVLSSMRKEGKELKSFTNRYRKKDGSYIWLEWNAHTLPDENASFAIARDITQKKSIEDKLRQRNIELNKIDALKTSFLNMTSHELRTPLTSIKGHLQMMDQGLLGEMTKQQRQSLEVVLRNTDHLDSLIQDILDISRLESGTMKFIPKKQDVNVCIDEIIQTIKPYALSKNIQINLEKGGNLLPEIEFDADRIKQVILNLINNAIKFSPEGSTITLRVDVRDEDVLFEVKDQGRGIPKDKLESIFDTFFQVESGVDRSYGGAGLGLAISRGIVLAHGGTIWAVSQGMDGEGSSFKFTLPIHSTGDAEERFRKVAVFQS